MTKELKHSINDLKQRQALPLSAKVAMTKLRIREWVDEFGVDGVYISFSGGKDSTVLLHIAREMFPDITAAFVDTGLEYPEIRDFVKTFNNVEWLKPKLTFKQVILKYGYPFISKEVSQTVSEARTSIKNGKTCAYRVKKLNGEVYDEHGNYSRYNIPQYKFLLDAPFEVSHLCCNVMKKAPAKKFEKETGRKPILATMAEESQLRTSRWLKEGCNAFDLKRPTSKPMSFWTEQDVLKYIKDNNLPICSVYGDIVPDYCGTQFEGQMDIADLGLINDNRMLKTTGCHRTGCMFCGFGCQREESPSRFERMKVTHPKQYEFIMKPVEAGGLGYKEVIDYLNEHGNLNIKY